MREYQLKKLLDDFSFKVCKFRMTLFLVDTPVELTFFEHKETDIATIEIIVALGA